MRWTLVMAVVTAGAVGVGGVGAVAQINGGGGASTQPVNTSQVAAQAGPTTRLTPADQLLNQMLKPAEAARRPLLPETKTTLKDATSGKGAVAPNAPEMPLLREGTFIVDRTGRLIRSADGSGTYEFAFDADGRALADPPVIVLPNSYLEAMEGQTKAMGKPIRFKVTGMVTTYRGRNGLLVQKALPLSEITQIAPP